MPFGRYNFGEWSLNELARTLTQQRRSAGAVAILELNAEFYPGSAAMDMVLGDLYRVGGEREKALVRYRMALEEEKYDAAMIFLNKILELDPMNAEAKLSKGEIYHRYLLDYPQAIDYYNKVIRLTANGSDEKAHSRARAGMSEIMEMLS